MKLGCDVFVLSKIAILEGFLLLATKTMSLFNTFLQLKFKIPPKIKILTNVKILPPQEKEKILIVMLLF